MEDAQAKALYEKMLKKYKDPLATIERREALAEFRTKYNVDKASPLICPACSHYMSIHKLYQRLDNPNIFVCRSCLLEFHIEYFSTGIEKLLETLKARKRDATIEAALAPITEPRKEGTAGNAFSA